LDACAGVEERQQQHMIAPPVRSRTLRRGEDGRDLTGLQILDQPRSRALERDRHEALTEVQVLRTRRRHKPGEGVDRGESGVPRRRAVPALAFQVLEKGDDRLRRDVLEVESHDGESTSLREKTEEERERIAIAADRVRAHAAYCRQVLGEEGAERTRERRRTRPHRFSPRVVKSARQWRSNRPLAAAASGSRRAR